MCALGESLGEVTLGESFGLYRQMMCHGVVLGMHGGEFKGLVTTKFYYFLKNKIDEFSG